MSVQTKVMEYCEQLDFADYDEQIDMEDRGNLLTGIKSGLAIMLPFYAILVGLFLLFRQH